MDDDYAMIKGLLWKGKYDEVTAMGEAAIPHVINALKAEWSGRSGAEEMLVRIGAPAIPALVNTLKHENWQVRWRAAEALGDIAERGGDCSAAVPALTDALREEHELGRWRAAGALEKIAKQIAGKAQNTEMLESVRQELKELIASVKRKAGVADASRIERAATQAYISKCDVLSQRSAQRQAMAGDGVILEGSMKPPSEKKMYRLERRAFA